MPLTSANSFDPGFKLRQGEELNEKTVDPLNLTITQVNTNTTNVATAASQIVTLTAGTFPRTATAAVTAFATGGQTKATQLTGVAANITVCATAADSVKLPAGVAGKTYDLVNNGSKDAQVFGNGTDTINDVATATGVVLTATKSAHYFCVSDQPAAKWYGGMFA